MPEVYRYGLRNRPPGYGSVPKGYIPDSDRPHERFRHGTIDYPEPLSAADLYRYELQFVRAWEGDPADEVQIDRPCWDCMGTGRAENRNHACPVCDGTGRTERP